MGVFQTSVLGPHRYDTTPNTKASCPVQGEVSTDEATEVQREHDWGTLSLQIYSYKLQ